VAIPAPLEMIAETVSVSESVLAGRFGKVSGPPEFLTERKCAGNVCGLNGDVGAPCVVENFPETQNHAGRGNVSSAPNDLQEALT
jgi:hypothetical protein